MPVDLILPTSILFALAAWTMIVAWYIHPLLKTMPLQRALEPLLLLHAFRYIGLMFLIPGVTAEILDSRFSHPAAYGDLAAAALALLSIMLLRMNARGAILSVWVFNEWGFVDLIKAVVRGMIYTADGHLGATFWIPAVIVPLLLVTHVYIFIQLVKVK